MKEIKNGVDGAKVFQRIVNCWPGTLFGCFDKKESNGERTNIKFENNALGAQNMAGSIKPSTFK